MKHQLKAWQWQDKVHIWCR